MGYIDITEKYHGKKKYELKKQKYFRDSNGIRHNVDGKHVILEPTQREIEVANILGEVMGGTISIIPRVNEPISIKTPDYIINKERYDLKEITGGGKYVIEGNLKNKREQSNNFIIDITYAKINLKEIKKQIQYICNSKRYLWIDKIFVISGNDVEFVCKRN